MHKEEQDTVEEDKVEDGGVVLGGDGETKSPMLTQVNPPGLLQKL